MENNYIERGAIGGFIDSLIEKKYPGQPLENYKDFREKSIDTIKDAIDDAILNSLDEKQLDELSTLLDDSDNGPDVFADFFEKSGVDIQQKIKEVFGSFQTQFLGAENE